ncbi:hypothetical protein NPIL_117921 [Nephila pilipes]|uniref:Uncharacterized protein n=1 Tax=Nephila pilipes TaxID=299642 RepID=A0A8X6NCJ4_NEPPI|nr:hypothetical protein NPIL_117921 [Nephila pilipes]
MLLGPESLERPKNMTLRSTGCTRNFERQPHPQVRSRNQKFLLPPTPPPVRTDQILPPRGKNMPKRTRDSERFISPSKHLTRRAPKANFNSQIKTKPQTDINPDVDVRILDPGVDITTPKYPNEPLPLFFSLTRKGIGDAKDALPPTLLRIAPEQSRTHSNTQTSSANAPRTGIEAPGILQTPTKAQKTCQKSRGDGSAKQPIVKQPPTHPDISGYRKVEPTLQYAAVLLVKTQEHTRINPPPPPQPNGEARYNAGMLKDLFEMIADTSVNRKALVLAFMNSLPALRAAFTDIDRSYIIFEAYCELL